MKGVPLNAGADSAELQSIDGASIKLLEYHISKGDWVTAESVFDQCEVMKLGRREWLDRARFHILCGQQRFPEAYRHSLLLAKTVRSEPIIRQLINMSLCFTAIHQFSQETEVDLILAMQDGGVDKRGIRSRVIEHLFCKYSLSDKLPAVSLEEWSKDKLLLLYLQSEYNVSAKLESLLINARAEIFHLALVEMNLPDELTPLVVAIGWQNWNNEYVHPQTTDEIALLAQLESLLGQQADLPGFDVSQVEGLLLLVAMYKPIGSLACADKLASHGIDTWPLSVAAIAKQTLFDLEKEQGFARQIVSIGAVEDVVSKKVRGQYEDNPYPRWKHCLQLASKLDYFDSMWRAHDFDGRFDKPKITGKVDVLVAGCGTGIHPLQIALNHNTHVTAIDITRRSLGYAAMKKAEYAAQNLDLFHMDLLSVEELQSSFDAIECSGVLHHMRDPEEGLRALLKVLKPGGIMTLGLYSELARQSVTRVRKAYQQSGMVASLENIRAVRQALLTSSASAYAKVTSFGDFFAASPCRDLLFHEQEHCYTTQALKEMLQRHDLEFMGFGVSPAIRSRFVALYGAEKLADLDVWGEFEHSNPDTFKNMYQFYVKRRSPEPLH